MEFTGINDSYVPVFSVVKVGVKMYGPDLLILRTDNF
jgi:hypothetical protein